MPRILSPLPSIQLDPRNTNSLLSAIQSRIYLESGGALNDFSPASPLSAITEGQAAATAELLYYLNNLPEAYAVQWMRLLGVQRVIGATAYVPVTFTRVASYGRPVYVPMGTELYTAPGLKFILSSDVTIDVTQSSAVGIAVSEKWGSIYNVPPRSITTIGRAIVGLDSAINFEPGRGGEDTETVAQMKSRAFAVLRRRSLITQEDYINEIFNIAPELDIVEMIPSSVINDDEDAPVNQLYFLMGRDTGQPIEFDVKSTIINSLKRKTPMGLTLTAIEPEYLPLKISVTVEFDSRISSATGVANDIRNLMTEQITPSNFGVGNSLDIAFVYQTAALAPGVVTVPRAEADVLILQDPDVEYTNACDPIFESFTDENGSCVRSSAALISEEALPVYTAEALQTFKVYQLEVVTLDNYGNGLVYNFDELYSIS